MPTTIPTAITVPTLEKRSVADAMWRGAKCTCPNCGEGKLFRAYLKTNDACANCGEVFSHHRADDLPPYLAIIIVGHVLVGLMLHLEMSWTIPPIAYVAIMVPLSIILPLVMLPSIKGAVVGLQWALRMHGFNPNTRDQ